jgi:hypothetical protein
MVSVLVCVMMLDLSGKGHPTSRYVTIGTDLRIIQPLKPHHYIKLEIPLVEHGYVSKVEGELSASYTTHFILRKGSNETKGQETGWAPGLV